jgi:hypothetical protein
MLSTKAANSMGVSCPINGSNDGGGPLESFFQVLLIRGDRIGFADLLFEFGADNVARNMKLDGVRG